MLLALLIFSGLLSFSQGICPAEDDIKPCYCQDQSGFRHPLFTCYSLTNSSELQRIFSQDFPDNVISRLDISISDLGTLPSNVFSNKQIEILRINETNISIQGGNTFASSNSTLLEFSINKCSVDILDLGVFNNFTSLATIKLYNSSIEVFLGGDYHPKLSTLEMYALDAFIPKLGSSPKLVQITNNPATKFRGITPEAFSAAPNLHTFTWIKGNFSVVTNGSFSFSNTDADGFAVDLSNNGIELLKAGSIKGNFNASSTGGIPSKGSINLSNNRIHTIEPEAISGLLGNTKILLAFNQITRLDEDVFRPLLGAIAAVASSASSAYIDLIGNRLDCDCSIAWLVRIPSLVPYAKYAVCNNNYSVATLTPNDFIHCPF